jgi:hypothetical protein
MLGTLCLVRYALRPMCSVLIRVAIVLCGLDQSLWSFLPFWMPWVHAAGRGWPCWAFSLLEVVWVHSFSHFCCSYQFLSLSLCPCVRAASCMAILWSIWVCLVGCTWPGWYLVLFFLHSLATTLQRAWMYSVDGIPSSFRACCLMSSCVYR